MSALAVEQPVVLLVEDLHWVDPSTLEFLSLLIDQGPMVRVYSLFTFRPDFAPPWGNRAHMTSITLSRLSRSQVTQMIDRLTSGKTLPVEILDHLITQTDGVPLFIEEVTKSILESGQLVEKSGHYERVDPFLSLTIPVTLNDALMERLDRLDSANAIAQLGATIGRQFSYPLIHAISQLDEISLRRELSKLVEVEVLYQQGVIPQATYLFKHALIQEASYQSLLLSTRQQYHERVAQALEAQFPAVVAQQPEVIARHYTEAGDTESAVIYWLRAGQNASTASAYLEAQAHLRTGLELLTTHPDTPACTEQERRLQLALGHVQMIIEGFSSPATEHTFVQALTLARASDDLGDHLQALRGLSAVYTQRGKLQAARELAEQSLDLAQRAGDLEYRLHAHRSLGLSLIHLGELMTAQTHFEKALALSEVQSLSSRISPGRDLKVESLGFLAPALWVRGYAEQALARIREMLNLAHAHVHPYSLCDALMDASLVYGYCGAWEAAYELADEGLVLAIEQGFATYRERGLVLRGRALIEWEQIIEGIAQLREGLAVLQATGAQRRQVQMSTWLIEAYVRNGQLVEGLDLLNEALAMAQAQEARIDEQRLYCLKGTLLLSLSAKHQGESEHWFRQALVLARACEAKSLELQAAMCLARLWQSQGKYQEAHDLLAPVYNWFTEGFDTADLKDAKKLLNELRAALGSLTA
ncbi:hypothetical protein C2W62_21575 [Candidatus Entotheonella serta]|nr:hypothetical protein C2W62_21575 [Candidatus Entotheonella serta]